MLRQIYLIRHAETFVKNISQSDFQRELTPKGEGDAKVLGIFLNSKKIQFDLLLSSPAVRTQSTAKIIAKEIDYPFERIHFDERIYSEVANELFTVLKTNSNEYSRIALIGHNPVISHLAEILSKENILSLAPCTAVALSFEAPTWSQVQNKSGQLIFIHSPSIS